jgi:hypothetical protein
MEIVQTGKSFIHGAHDDQFATHCHHDTGDCQGYKIVIGLCQFRLRESGLLVSFFGNNVINVLKRSDALARNSPT